MRTIVVGDPTYFRVKSGSNPHTRNLWGFKKRVDPLKARRQWDKFVDQLRDLGVKVLIVPPVKSWPGLVYTANAGVVIDRDEEKSFSDKIFLMSELTPGRSGESDYYQEFFKKLGFQVRRPKYRFEGEADFFPAGPYYMFTYGRIERQRYQFQIGFPPYRRVYGFRSDRENLSDLSRLVRGSKVIPLELIDERFYHGDTVCCSFGTGFQYILVYFDGLTQSSQDLLKLHYPDKFISISQQDAFQYAANSFYVETFEGRFLLMPKGVSQRVQDQVKERGVNPILVDVSEFFEKGGGSVKCMLLDLGPYVDNKSNIKNYK